MHTAHKVPLPHCHPYNCLAVAWLFSCATCLEPPATSVSRVRPPAWVLGLLCSSGPTLPDTGCCHLPVDLGPFSLSCPRVQRLQQQRHQHLPTLHSGFPFVSYPLPRREPYSFLTFFSAFLPSPYSRRPFLILHGGKVCI